ncbi:MAG: PEP-CTERM sorting domain-containing protein [Chthoniobacterales bacterium]
MTRINNLDAYTRFRTVTETAVNSDGYVLFTNSSRITLQRYLSTANTSLATYSFTTGEFAVEDANNFSLLVTPNSTSENTISILFNGVEKISYTDSGGPNITGSLYYAFDNRISGAGADSIYGDISVSSIPEPSMAALLGLASIAAFTFHRKK